MSARFRKWLPLVIGLALILLLDQVSKAWVIANIPYGSALAPLPVLHPLIQIVHSSNTGAAFGVLPMAGDAFLVLACLIVVVMLVYYARSAADLHTLHIGLTLVIAGALGNVIDRLQHGHVVDFVYVSLPGGIGNVSNFADHAITLGVIVLIIESYVRERRSKLAAQNSASALLSE